MSYTMDDLKRDCLKKQFIRLAPEERLEILESLSPEEQCQAIADLPPSRIRAISRRLEVKMCQDYVLSMSPEERQEWLRSLPIDVLLGGITKEQLRQELERRAASEPAPPRKRGRKK